MRSLGPHARAYLQTKYTGTSLIQNIPKCPVCEQNDRVDYEALADKQGRINNRFVCNRCMRCFFVPDQSHVIITSEYGGQTWVRLRARR